MRSQFEKWFTIQTGLTHEASDNGLFYDYFGKINKYGQNTEHTDAHGLWYEPSSGLEPLKHFIDKDWSLQAQSLEVQRNAAAKSVGFDTAGVYTDFEKDIAPAESWDELKSQIQTNTNNTHIICIFQARLSLYYVFAPHSYPTAGYVKLGWEYWYGARGGHIFFQEADIV